MKNNPLLQRLGKSFSKRFHGNLIQALREALRDWITWRDDLSIIRLNGALLRFFGYKRYYARNGYHYLERKFSNGAKLDFKKFNLPHIDKQHRRVFVEEFGDLVAPYIWPQRYQAWPQSEGPYENFCVSLRQNDVVIDAGANIGLFAATSASRGITVYAFEPMPDALKYLLQTVAINPHLAIIPVQYALMDFSGTIEMESSLNNIGGSSAIIDRKTGKKTSVNCITLDDWVTSNNIPRIDFIKADIEGAERFLLKGAAMVLQKYQPRLAICTYHLKDDPQVLKDIILQANPNYKIFLTETKLFAI